jgi:hypothetical protein
MRIKYLSLLVASFLFVRCGVKEPRTALPQDLNELPRPDYSLKQTGLKLDGLNQGLGLSGSLVFWKKQEDGNIEPFKKVVNYSASMKESMGSITRVNKEKEALSQELSQAQARVAKIFGSHVKSFFDSLQKEKMIADHLRQLEESNLPEKDFDLYCDSQYVDFCRSKLLLEENYKERPTPNALCENYYKAKSYFIGDDCLPSETGKNYLSCFWSTDFFEKSNFKLKKGRELEEITFSEIRSQKFQDFWKEENWAAIFSETERYLKLGILKVSREEKLFFYFDDEKKQMGQHLSLPMNSQLSEIYTRNRSLDGGAKYSFSDIIFNSSRLADKEKMFSTYSIRKEDEENLVQLSSNHLNLFLQSYKSFDASGSEEAKELEKLRNNAEKKNEELNIKAVEFDKNLEETKKLFDNLFYEKDEKGKEKDLAYSMWPTMKITLAEENDGTVKLSWRLHDTLLTSKNGKESIDPPTFSCTLKKAGTDKTTEINQDGLTQCSFDRSTGKLKFTLDGETLSKAGWMLQEKTGNGQNPFNFIDLTELEGATLSFNLDYIHYGDMLPMFTGEATLSIKKMDYWGTVLVKSF